MFVIRQRRSRTVARVAGAPTAMLLAQQGYSVLLVDRNRFPSDTMSTHYIHQPGVAALKRWGLLDRVIATGAQPVRRITVERAGIALTGMARFGAIDFTICPRRYALDDLLVRAAGEAGAELREDFVVDDLIWDGGTVTGIRGHHKGGPTGVPGAEPPIGGGWGTARVPQFEVEQALAGYEARRNERALPLYEMAMQAISFQPVPAERRLLLQALQGNQADTDRFLGLTSGAPPPPSSSRRTTSAGSWPSPRRVRQRRKRRTFDRG